MRRQKPGSTRSQNRRRPATKLRNIQSFLFCGLSAGGRSAAMGTQIIEHGGINRPAKPVNEDSPRRLRIGLPGEQPREPYLLVRDVGFEKRLHAILRQKMRK